MTLSSGSFSLVRSEHRRLQAPAVLTGVLLPLAAALGYLAGSHDRYAVLGAGAVLLVGAVTADARVLPFLAVPATLLIMRVGGSGTNLSVSDFVLFLAVLCALPMFRLKQAPEVRRLLLVVCVYQASTLLTVIDNPYRADYIEWFHEILLVAGSLVVGWVVGRNGWAKAAISAFIAGACVVGGAAALFAVAHHFHPVYPFGLQKNYVGDMLAFAALLAYARPSWARWRSGRWRLAALAVCILGILGTQSKQAMVGLAVGVGVLLVRNQGWRRRSKAIVLAIVPLGIIAYVGASNELASSNRFNSVHQRLTWFQQSLHLWHLSPWLGVGLRWWYTSRFPFHFQPPNAEAEMLTSAGIVGLLGFIVLIAGSLQVLRRVPHAFGTVALAIIVMRVVEGQLDIFWVGAQGSLPWMVVGIALGVAALERSQATGDRKSRLKPSGTRSVSDPLLEPNSTSRGVRSGAGVEAAVTDAGSTLPPFGPWTANARWMGPTSADLQFNSQVAATTTSGNASGRQLLRNFVTGYLGLGTSIVLSLLLTPVVLNHLGATNYGLWILIVTVGTYVGLFDAGVGTAAVRQIAVETALGRTDRVANVLASARAFFIGSGVAAILINCAFLPFVGAVFGLRGNELTEMRWGLLLMSVFTVFGFMTKVPGSALTGRGYNERPAMISLVVNIMVQAAQIAVIVVFGGGVVSVVGITAAGAVLTFAGTEVVARRFGTVTRGRASWSILRELMRSGARNAAVSLGGTIMYGIDAIVIGAILPVGQVAPYDLALSTVNLVNNVSTTATDQLLPTYAHSQATGDSDREFRLFTRAVLMSMVVTLSMTIALVGFGPGILELWLRGSVPVHTYEILVVMNLVYILQLPGHQAFVYLTGVGKNRLLARIALPLAALNLGLSVPLTLWLGPVGPLLANVPQALIVNFWLLVSVSCEAMGRRYRDYVRRALLPLLAPASVACGLTILMRALVEPSNQILGPVVAVFVVAVSLAVSIPAMARGDPELRERIGQLRARLASVA